MQKLKQWREANNLTLDQLGSKIGTSGVAVGRYEAGRVPRDEFMRRIIEVTGGEVTANDWFDIPAPVAGTAAE